MAFLIRSIVKNLFAGSHYLSEYWLVIIIILFVPEAAQCQDELHKRGNPAFSPMVDLSRCLESHRGDKNECKNELKVVVDACLGSSSTCFSDTKGCASSCLQAYMLEGNFKKALDVTVHMQPNDIEERRVKDCYRNVRPDISVATNPPDAVIIKDGKVISGRSVQLQLGTESGEQIIVVKFPESGDSQEMVVARSIRDKDVISTEWNSLCNKIKDTITIARTDCPEMIRGHSDCIRNCQQTIDDSGALYPCDCENSDCVCRCEYSEATTDDDWLQGLGLGLTIAGGVTTILGVGFGLAAIINNNKVNDDCRRSGEPNDCSLEDFDHNRLAQTYETAAAWTLGLGLPTLAVGVILLLTADGEASDDSGNENARSDGYRVAPIISHTMSGLQMQTNW